MVTRQFVFKHNSATGLPRLEAVGIDLRDYEEKSLAAELSKKFERLIHCGDGKLVTFDTSLSAFPKSSQFRIRVQRGATTRYPDLVFEPMTDLAQPVEPEEIDEAESENRRDRFAAIDNALTTTESSFEDRCGGDWPDGFFQEVESLFSERVALQLKPADRVALRFIIDELNALGHKRRAELMPVLLAGYCALGERMCRDHDIERLGMYVLASRGVESVFEDLLPQRTPMAAETAEVDDQDAAFRIKLRKAGRFLARVLGIEEETF